jgi:hypothetical protein
MPLWLLQVRTRTPLTRMPRVGGLIEAFEEVLDLGLDLRLPYRPRPAGRHASSWPAGSEATAAATASRPSSWLWGESREIRHPRDLPRLPLSRKSATSSRCPQKYATLRGKHRSGCVRGTAGWLHRASPVSWPLPRSPAKWSASSGQSPASSSQWSQTRALSERATRRGADSGPQSPVDLPLRLDDADASSTTPTGPTTVTFASIKEKRKNKCRQPSRSKPPEPSRSKPHQTIQSCALPETGPRWGTLLTCNEPVRRPTLVIRVRQPRDESTVMR